MANTHKFYSDAGHGWLAVPRQELITLGILHKISHYSYELSSTVYLEEDCDLSTYAAAIDATGKRFACKHMPQVNGHSKIRSYFSFSFTEQERATSEANDRTPAAPIKQTKQAEQLSIF
jgi:hypothetical protein